MGNLFDTTSFVRFGTCGDFPPWLLTLLISADLAIFSAYMGIPFLLLLGLKRSSQIRSALLGTTSRTITILFVLFILGCGLTHLARAVMALLPMYYLLGVIGVATAFISLLTFAALILLGPKLSFFQLGVHQDISTLQQLVDSVEGRELKSPIEDDTYVLSRLRESLAHLKALNSQVKQ